MSKSRAAGRALIAEALAARTATEREAIAAHALHVTQKGHVFSDPGAVGSAHIARAMVARGATERNTVYASAQRVVRKPHVFGAENVANALVAMAYSATSPAQRTDVRDRASYMLSKPHVYRQPGAVGAASIAMARVARGRSQKREVFEHAERLVRNGHVHGHENVGNALVAMALTADTAAERETTESGIAHVNRYPHVYKGPATGAAQIAAATLARRTGAGARLDLANRILDAPHVFTHFGSANAAIAIVIIGD